MVRKSILNKQNELLNDKLFEADRYICKLKEKIDEQNDEISLLKDQIKKLGLEIENLTTALEEVKTKSASDDNNESLETELVKDSVASDYQKISLDDFDFVSRDVPLENADSSIKNYCVKVISNIILEATRLNCVLASKDSDIKKELINLVLGRCETAKETISQIMLSGKQEIEIRSAVDSEYRDATDYFKSVFAQL